MLRIDCRMSHSPRSTIGIPHPTFAHTMSSQPLIAALNERFGKTPGVTIDLGNGDLPRLRVRTSMCTGEIYLHGAHVTAFRPQHQEPVLWMSEASAFAPGKAIRGGVPICFPWFGFLHDDRSLPQHGFARTNEWELIECGEQPTGEISMILRLPTRPEFAAHGYERIETYFAVLFGTTLEMGLLVRNNGTKPFRYEAALHTYFSVGDVGQVWVEGLKGATFRDKTQNMAQSVETRDRVVYDGEVDRVYDSDATAVLHDPLLRRRIVVEKVGGGQTVVWNIAEAKSASIGLAPGEWQRYACVETAAAGPGAITLAPGAAHTLGAHLRVEPL